MWNLFNQDTSVSSVRLLMDTTWNKFNSINYKADMLYLILLFMPILNGATDI